MAYIGKTPVIGNFVKLDSITVVNGQAAYTMQNGGVNFTSYDNVNQFLVSLNGVLQAPTDSFTVSGYTLTFASSLSTGDVIDFVLVLGNSLDIGTPSDNTISTAKLQANAVTSAKLGTDVSLGKVLQVVTATDSTARDTTSTSFVTASNTLTLNITPSSTSSKIYLLATFTGYGNTSGKSHYYTFYRDSTNLGDSTNGLINSYDTNSTRVIGKPMAMSILDSPSSTSQITYQVYIKAESGGNTYLNYSNNQGSITAFEIGA